MIIVISPAKTIVSNLTCNCDTKTQPVFLNQANKLSRHLQTLNIDELKKLMHISPKLAELNYERYLNWNHKSTPQIPAICAFKGEVYNGMRGWEFNEDELNYAQSHLTILSGMYGLLKPLDVIKPHRLEMGTVLKLGALYDFWGDKITLTLNQILNDNGGPLVNLASNEYYKSINTKRLKHRVVTPEFKDYHKGTYKVISIYAKKARGLMSRFILENKLKDIEDLKAFNADGYYYNAHFSSDNNPVFTRDK